MTSTDLMFVSPSFLSAPTTVSTMELEELFALDRNLYDLDGALDATAIGPPPSAFSFVIDDGDTVDLTPVSRLSVQNSSQEPRRRPMKNPARERLKRELGFLRECVAELEQTLSTLQSQKRTHTAMAATSTTLSVVETERRKRTRAEKENERLKRSLENQLRVATELTVYLRDREATGVDNSVTHIPPVLFSSFSFAVTQFLQDIDRAYAVVDTVFAGPSWETLPDERVFQSTVKTRRCQGYEQMYIELMDTAYRSHDYERACAAAWEATRQVYASEDKIINRGPSTDDVIAARYRSAGVTRRGMAKDLIVTCVARKFREKDRTLIVWRTGYSPAQHDSDIPSQALSDETGWMVLTRVPQGIVNRAAGTAFFQACNRLVPVWYEGDVADSSVRSQLAIGEFTNVVLSATEADVSGFEHAFQRLVLDDMSDGSDTSEDSESVSIELPLESSHDGIEDLIALV